MRKMPKGSSKMVKWETKRLYYEKNKIIYTMEDSEDENTIGD